MPNIPEDVLDAVRQAVPVHELLSRYLPLKRSGGAYKALCPFHQEKSASFHAWPDRGIWKCFGCGKGGNVFTFLMEREGLSFPEAVRQLAREAGIALPDEDPESARQAERLGALREVTEWACRRFESVLRSPEGAAAVDYLKRRGIRGETARDFRLGFAPPGWDGLLEAGRAEGVADDLLLEAGLVKRRDAGRGLYDVFRDRVVFPIADAQGRVIAFGARTLGQDEPKYLNSPETPLFTKGRHLYALHLAKQEMLRTGTGAVMEGYTDVLMAHQAGFRCAVAGLGTALTADQAARISRYVERLFLVYDGDAAGRRAAERAIPEFLPETIETRVALLPEGQDPCDLVLEGGLPALEAVLEQGREAFEHLLLSRAAAHDLTSVPGRAAAVEEVLTALVGVRDEVRRSLYVKRVADELGVSEEAATGRLRDLRARAIATERRAPRPSPPAQGPSAVPAPGPRPPDPQRPDLQRTEPSPPSEERRPQGPPPRLESCLLEALLALPDLAAEAAGRLPPEAFAHPLCRELWRRLLAALPRGGAGAADALVASVAEPELAELAAGLRAGHEGKDLPRQGRDCLERLLLQHEERLLEAELRVARGTPAEAGLYRKLVDLHRRRSGPRPV